MVKAERAGIARRVIGRLLVAYIVLTATYSVVGLAIVHWWDGSSFGDRDASVNRWLEARRTPFRTDLSHWGSALSDTFTKIALVLALAPVMWWLYRRWRDWAFVVLALLLEVSVFGTASEIVRRDRPPVEQLDGAPTNSWPSGHVAASIAFYVGLAIVIFANDRRRQARVVGVLLAVAGPVGVISARLYQGMHYPTDVAGGLVLGALSLLIVHRVLRASLPPDRRDPPDPDGQAVAISGAGTELGSSVRSRAYATQLADSTANTNMANASVRAEGS